MVKSDLACHSCRKRKVKCDRVFPQCEVCEQTGQTCDYPLRPMKPGPKIGSLQRQKRNQARKSDQKQKPASYPSPQNEPDIHSYDDDLIDPHDDLKKGRTPLASADHNFETMARTDSREGSDRQELSHLNMHDLSYILHPSHEASTPDQDKNQSPSSSGQAGLCRQACQALAVSQTHMNQIIRIYFDNMVAINLFHEPSFAEKLMEIPSLSQLIALLAAIAGYASRFLQLDLVSDEHFPRANHQQPTQFIDIAFKYIDKALAECDDEMPPLCVIQALIITTHCQLTRGVHGKAWRWLGLCVRLAYETNLHLVDSGMDTEFRDPVQWQIDEEKRRAFWAIWEMDVFASTIRRTPTAIDWRQMEILLPVDNNDWFHMHPAPSCFMEADSNQRWKALQDSGNMSPKAWFLVINSLMKAAQTISNPRGVSSMGNPIHYQPSRQNSTSESIEAARRQLETLANAVHCFCLALPSHLNYRDQHLAFGSPVSQQLESQRQQHCSIHNIFVMTQLARLMIYRYDAFRPQTRRFKSNSRHRSGDAAAQNSLLSQDTESVALRHYFEAADSILRIVSQSCEEHIRYINPFLSSTIWLASAVQLVRKHFVRSSENRSLVKSRFDVLHFTYKRCVHFWDTQTAMQQNLESLEEQLEAKQGSIPNSTDQRKPLKRTLGDARLTNQSSCNHQAGKLDGDSRIKRVSLQPPSHTVKLDNPRSQSTRKRQDHTMIQFMPESPSAIHPVISFQGQDGPQSGIIQDYTGQELATTEQRSMLDFMPLLPTSPLSFSSVELDDLYQDSGIGRPDHDLPVGIHDLLAGWSTY